MQLTRVRYKRGRQLRPRLLLRVGPCRRTANRLNRCPAPPRPTLSLRSIRVIGALCGHSNQCQPAFRIRQRRQNRQFVTPAAQTLEAIWKRGILGSVFLPHSDWQSTSRERAQRKTRFASGRGCDAARPKLGKVCVFLATLRSLRVARVPRILGFTCGFAAWIVEISREESALCRRSSWPCK